MSDKRKSKTAELNLGFSNKNLYPGHKKLMSRRDFLAHSTWALGGFVAMPSLVSTLMGKAYAEEMGLKVSENERIPYLCFDLAGGANICGSNFLVGFERGQDQLNMGTARDNSFLRLGIPASMSPRNSRYVDQTYNVAFHSESGFLRGLNSILDRDAAFWTAARKKQHIDGAVICANSADDTDGNALNTVYLANLAGAKGQVVELIGNRSSKSGGNSQPGITGYNASIKPSVVRSFTEAQGLLNLGPLGGRDYVDISSTDGRGQERINFLMQQIKKLNSRKLASLDRRGFLEQIRDLLDGRYNRSAQLFKEFSASVLNPGSNARLVEIFGNNDQQVSSVAHLVINGYAGAGTVLIGGCDYHDGSNVTGDAKDFQIGQYVGKCIEYARAQGKSLFLHGFTDGGVTGSAEGALDPTNGKVIWASDSGNRGGSWMMVYRHKTSSESIVRDGRPRQIGNYIVGGGADMEANDIADNMTNLTKVVALNYLAAQGRESKFLEVTGENLPASWERYILFNKVI